MASDLWVDFNDLEGAVRLTVFTDRVRGGVAMRRGAVVTLRDGEGGSARAVVKGRSRWRRHRRITVRVMTETLHFG